MSWLSSLRDSFKPIPDPVPEERATPRPPSAAIARGDGGRLSVDTLFSYFGAAPVVIPPTSESGQWSLAHFDEHFLARMPAARMAHLLADLSPDVSRALWDFLRLTNPGWEFTATRPGGATADTTATVAVQSFLDQLSTLYGSPDVVWTKLFSGAFIGGALFAELVLDETGRQMVDIATPDPFSARFQRYTDPVRGQVYQLGQWQAGRPGTNGSFIALDRPTIQYIGIDPLPGVPYGRPMVTPALFGTVFLLDLFRDLKRVIQQQGYPRLDASVDSALLKAAAPPNVANDPERWEEWVNDTLKDVTDAYESLQPDDLFVHMDYVDLNRPLGTLNHSSLGSLDTVIEALERQSVRALKSVPFMMALNMPSTESMAIRSWELMTQTIRSVQHHAEALIEHLLEVGLQAQGIAANVEFRFAENRSSEEIRDATAEGLRISNAAQQYSWGWISQDEAAKAGAGKDKADTDAPRILPRGATETTAADAAQLAPEAAGGLGNTAENRATALRVVGED